MSRPRAWLRALAGLVAALVAVGVGHGLAAFVDPAASPLLAVGGTVINLTPTSVKTAAVSALGTNDKPVLITGVAVILAVFAVVLGLIAWRHRMIALAGIGLLGVAGLAASLSNGGSPADGLPSIAAGVVGMITMYVLSRLGTGPGNPATVENSADDTAENTAENSADEPAEDSGGKPATPSRRGLLIGLGVGAVVAAAGGVTGVLVGRSRAAMEAARQRLGLPRPTSPASAIPAGAQVSGDTPFVTDIDDFYRVDIALTTPQVGVDDWTLTIDGMVDQPLTLSYDDLLAMPMIERNITLTCVSNEVGGPYVSTAKWLGVPFSEIIKRVGVQDGVDQVYSYSSDSGYTCSTPYQAVSDGRDAMIVVGMNDEVLPAKNGFPARMLVPGLFGFVSGTKWLKRLEFTTYAKREAYWTERGWATDAPILLQSRIDVPDSLGTVTKAKPMLAGVAWEQHVGIAKVEVQIDDGPWQEASLATDAGVDLWRQWSLKYDGPSGRHTAQVRATSTTGQVQPQNRTKVFPSGATGWHQIVFNVE